MHLKIQLCANLGTKRDDICGVGEGSPGPRGGRGVPKSFLEDFWMVSRPVPVYFGRHFFIVDGEGGRRVV